MSLITPTLVAATGTSSPGATSQATASLTPVSGHGYLVFLHTIKLSVSTNPNVATLTGAGGWNTTWTEVTGMGLLYTSTGTTRRRVQVFKGTAVSNTAGALTFANLNTLDAVDWIVVDCGVTDSNILVAGSEKAGTPDTTFANGTMQEKITLNAATDATNNYPIVFHFGNTNNATVARPELNSDTGGEADWTLLGRFNTGTAPVRTIMCAYRTDFSDLTPGALWNAATSGSSVGCEIDALVAAARLPYWGISGQP